jgi:hypothetical protein
MPTSDIKVTIRMKLGGKAEATPKNHTPTARGPEGYTKPEPFKTSESSSRRNRRRAKNRIAAASRKANRK